MSKHAPMKSEAEIEAARKRLLQVWSLFGDRHGFSFHGTECTAEQLHFMSMGAVAFANEVLQIRPDNDNLGRMLAAMERDNEKEVASA